MSRENAEVIRGVYARWGEGDFSDPVAAFDPDVTLVMRRGFPDTGTHVGLEAVARYTRSFLEPWTRTAIEAEEITEAGDQVIAAVYQHGVGGGSGVPAEFRYFHVWTLRDGRVIRLETARTADEANELVSSQPQ